MHSRSIIAVKSGKISSFLIVEQYSIVYIYTTSFLSIHPLMGICFFCPHSLVIVNYALMNKGVQIYHQIFFFIFEWHIPRSGNAGPYNRSIFLNFEKFQHVFQGGSTNLHSYQEDIRVLLFHSLSSPAVSCLPCASYSDIWELVSHHAFPLLFPDD